MLDGGQFLISGKKIDRPDFISIRLADGYTLSYHNRLPVYIHENSDILLLGTAWQVRRDRQDPVREIERLVKEYPDGIPEEEILAMEESWCGRYVLIVQGRVYLDATGLLGIFYSAWGISCSIRILAEAAGLPEKIYYPASDFNWLPGPLTQYEGIKRLLPGQVYDYRASTVHGRQLLASHTPVCEGEEDRIGKFTEAFSDSLKNLACAVPGKKLLIALTGGYDSRTLAALAWYAGIPFECFTLGYDNISPGDVEIPKALCRILNCAYTYIERDPEARSEKREKEYVRHTGGLADDGDKKLYIYGEYRELARRFGEVVILRGSIWSVVAEDMEKVTGNSLKPDSFYDYYNIDRQGLEGKSLEEYFQWADKHPQDNLSAANRFFWEQYKGSWLSSIEQSFDVMEGVTSLQPLNSRFLITLLAGFPKEERMVKKHQVKIIFHACPELAKVRFGDGMPANTTFLSLWSGRMQKLGKMAGRIGMKKTVEICLKTIRVQRETKRLKRK